MDLNNHSDIAVGAFESDVAVILRSRPVVQVVTWFGDRPRKIDPDLPGCAADPDSETPCFTVESCFLLKKFPSNIDRTYVRYRLSAEAFPGGRKISRVHFGGHSKDNNSTSSDPPHVATRTVAVFRESLTGCFLETAYLREGISDLTTPIDFQLDLRLEQDEVVGDVRNSRAIPNINQFPVLEKSSATKVISLPFQKWCGEDDVCNSQLSVKLSITPGYDPLRRRLEVATRTEVRLVLDVSNTGEPAYAATAELDIDPAFYYVGRSDNVTAVNCDFDEKKVSYINIINRAI